MLISKKQHLELLELAKPIKEHIDNLTNSSSDNFIKLIQQETNETWNGIYVDLFHYIPVLNRIDDILEQHIKKYELDQTYPKLLEVPATDETIICSVLDYSNWILEHSNNGKVYNSAERVFQLLKSSSLNIKLSSLKLSCLLGEKYSTLDAANSIAPPITKSYLLHLATSFPPPITPASSKPTSIEVSSHKSSSSSSSAKRHKKQQKDQPLLTHVSLMDCMSPDTEFPSRWRVLDYKYYNAIPDKKKEQQLNLSHSSLSQLQSSSKQQASEKSPTTKKNNNRRNKKQILNTQGKKSKSDKNTSHENLNSEGLHHFLLGEETLKKLSLQQIFDKAQNIIPKNKWDDFVLSVYIAKAFNNRSFESIQLRQKLVSIKCYAVAASCRFCTYSSVASAVFDEESYLLSYMADLINPDNSIPFEPSLAALKAFVSISRKKAGGSDLMRALGGNVSHGLLFHIFKNILKAAKEDRTDMNPQFLDYYFELIANLTKNNHLVTMLRSAGLTQILLEFLSLRNTMRITRYSSIQLVDLLVDSSPEALDDIIEDNGFKILIELLQYEIEFAIANPSFEGGAPRLSNVTYLITARQVDTINSLLQLVISLLANHAGDRMRNLYDSPLLKQLIKIMEHPDLFGNEILGSTISLVGQIINSEPTAYPILSEAGVIDSFFANFSGFLRKSKDLLHEIPDTINAICLNNAGLTKVAQSNLIDQFFEIFKDQGLCKELLKNEESKMLGESFDELCRHHPELKPVVEQNVIKLIKETPTRVSFKPTQFYQSPKGSLYYSKSDEILKDEDGSCELPTWETCDDGDILECSTAFLEMLLSSYQHNSNHWNEFYKTIDVKDLMKFITIENNTFDYVMSNCLFSVASIIKAVVEQKKGYGLQELLDEVYKYLKEITDFIYFDSDEQSYFCKFDKNSAEAASNGGSMLSKISIVNSLLFVLSDVYASPNRMSLARVQLLSRTVQTETNLECLHEMVMFYRRIVLEEVIGHSRTPKLACKELISQNRRFQRYNIEIGEPNQEIKGWDGTSAKFKNLSMMFFHFAKCQSWLRYTFATLCRLSADKRQESKMGMTPKYSLHIVSEFSNYLLDTLDNIHTSSLEIKTGYLLLMTNQLYTSMFMRPRSPDPISTIMIVCLLQNGFFIKLREIAIDYFKLLATFSEEDVRKYSKLNYVDIHACSTTLKLLGQILTIYTQLSTKSQISPIPAAEKIYPDIKKNNTFYYLESLSSVQIQLSLASFGLLNELLSTDSIQILENNPQNIPLQLVEKLVLLSKNFFITISATLSAPVFSGRLYPARYTEAAPSNSKLRYLESLGIPIEQGEKFLLFFKNKLDPLFSDDLEGFIESYEEEIGNIDWKAVGEKAKETRYVPPQMPETVPPQYQHVCTLDDLNFVRGANESNFVEYWIQMTQLYPKASLRISDLLTSVFVKSSYGEHTEFGEILTTVFMNICSFSFSESNKEDAAKLSSILELLAFLLDDRSINKYTEIVDDIISFITDELKPEVLDSVWLPNALLVLEKILAVCKVPKAPTADKLFMDVDNQRIPATSLTFPTYYSYDLQAQQKLFDLLINVSEIEKVETALSIGRILILLCSSDHDSSKIAKSPVLKALVKVVQRNTNTESNLQGIVITLIRYCMESHKIIESYISKAVERVLSTGRKKDLGTIVKEYPSFVMRSDSTFIDSMSDAALLYKCTAPLKSMLVTAIRPEEKKVIESIEATADTDTPMKESSDEPSTIVTQNVDNSNYSTGIMQFLLSELMVVGKRDLISSPTENEADTEEDKTKKPDERTSEKVTIYKNKDYAYALFLLQTIAELLFSYKQAKTEFLTFSKKAVDPFVLGKPRSTALNLLIHRFVPSTPFINTDVTIENKRRRMLSLIAGVCIFALVSTTPVKGIDHEDAKLVDPDMTFVRKFTVDMIIRILKETSSNVTSALDRYGRIVDILDLVCKLLGDKYEYSVTTAVDKRLTQHDPYFFAVELLDKKFPSVLSSVLADLDVNFPQTEQISSVVMRCLSSLGSIRVQNRALFKDSHSGEDDLVLTEDELDEKEETPDLLRNSTLGMYDVEDIEDEEDFDDFLDDEDVEVVFSDGGDDEDDPMNSDVGEHLVLAPEDDSIEVIDDTDESDSDDDGGEDSDDEGGSVDEILDGGRFVIDIVSESDSDEDDSMGDADDEHGLDHDDEGDDESGYTDFDASDIELDLVPEGESAFEEEEEEDSDDGDDGDDVNILDMVEPDNSDDDSAVLEDWLIENDNTERRRRPTYRQSDFRRAERNRDRGLDLNRILDIERLSMGSRAGNVRIIRAGSDGMGGFDIPYPAPSYEGNGTFSIANLARQVLPRLEGDYYSETPHITDLMRMLDDPNANMQTRVPNIYLRSTVQRWTETAQLFYGKTLNKEACRVIPSIINNIFDKSMMISEDQRNKEKEKQEKARKAREEEEANRRKQELEAANARQEALGAAAAAAAVDREPVYVTIGGRPVDISGTDIDPEFLQALPDDMREDVFAQHVRERRAEANNTGESITEVDPSFMAALPDDLREEIVRDEQRASLQGRLFHRIVGNHGEHEDEDDGSESGSTDEFDGPGILLPSQDDSAMRFISGTVANALREGNRHTPVPVLRDPSREKKKEKLYFPPMVDRYGVAALLKMVFVPQLYYKRESFFKTLGFLCFNKQTRAEIIALLLYILQEGLNDQASLEAVYLQLCQRAKIPGTSDNSAKQQDEPKTPVKGTSSATALGISASFPTGCTGLTVATQAIDIIQYLLEHENHMRFHFLTDQENNPFIRKLGKRHKLKDSSYKYPINILLNLLDHKLIKEDNNLMDILSRTFQIATRPLQMIKSKLARIDEADKSHFKSPQLPVIPDKNLRQIINILIAEECANKVFQQTIASIQNLSVLDNAKFLFPHELSKNATSLSKSISTDLRELVKDLNTTANFNSDDLPALAKFSSGSSDQAKLLRVLTALDYLFNINDKTNMDSTEAKELKELYKSSALGPLWGALSDCLRILTTKEDLSYIATILSPLIEALMVVCKHSKVESLPIRDVLRYEEKVRDFSSEPIESLFFSFTEEHKKILNQMIRRNPKLMSGPFAVLIRNPKVLEFDNKRIYFEQKLHEGNEDRNNLSITIRRDQVFLDSYRALFFKPPDLVRKSNLEIHFRGEEGVDAGGLTREWYQVLARQMFNPDYALYTPVASDKTTFHPNRTSWVNPEHLSFFKFVGIIIGKAIFDGYMLDCHFSRAVFKQMLGRPVSLKDIESLDLDYYKSLVWMLENDINDIIVETFSVETDDYGEHKIIDLKENGRDIAVTQENKQEYVRLIVEYKLQTSIKEQITNFLEGFHQIIPKDLVSIFDDQELELLISGLPDIDVDDWKNNTNYVNYSASSAQIQWFWRAVKSFDQEEKAKLLQFSTGTSKVPLNGFKELSGMNGISKFSIHRVYDSTDRLPSAHTCFNQIDLPEYESYEKLRGSLLLAITEGHEGFGFA